MGISLDELIDIHEGIVDAWDRTSWFNLLRKYSLAQRALAISVLIDVCASRADYLAPIERDLGKYN